jgi:hypothetical protein
VVHTAALSISSTNASLIASPSRIEIAVGKSNHLCQAKIESFNRKWAIPSSPCTSLSNGTADELGKTAAQMATKKT